MSSSSRPTAAPPAAACRLRLHPPATTSGDASPSTVHCCRSSLSTRRSHCPDPRPKPHPPSKESIREIIGDDAHAGEPPRSCRAAKELTVPPVSSILELPSLCRSLYHRRLNHAAACSPCHRPLFLPALHRRVQELSSPSKNPLKSPVLSLNCAEITFLCATQEATVPLSDPWSAVSPFLPPVHRRPPAMPPTPEPLASSRPMPHEASTIFISPSHASLAAPPPTGASPSTVRRPSKPAATGEATILRSPPPCSSMPSLNRPVASSPSQTACAATISVPSITVPSSHCATSARAKSCCPLFRIRAFVCRSPSMPKLH